MLDIEEAMFDAEVEEPASPRTPGRFEAEWKQAVEKSEENPLKRRAEGSEEPVVMEVGGIARPDEPDEFDCEWPFEEDEEDYEELEPSLQNIVDMKKRLGYIPKIKE